MALELVKAKAEARRARKEAINALDRYISTLTVALPNIKDDELRKKSEEEIARLIATRDVCRKKTELPKWVGEVLSTGLKLVTLVGSVLACEIVTSRGTGDKFITEGFKRLPGL